uniref:Yippee domain-containing protein n=1 Tax=Tetraselmis sp. GSL018 TaxID=582737 RepID=A0A061R433_9CHLO
MGRLFVEVLQGHCYVCRCCHGQLAELSTLLSKQFHSRHGKAYGVIGNGINFSIRF